mgnify:CR=1 FL=1
MLIELKKNCIGESDAGNQIPPTGSKVRNARRGRVTGFLKVRSPAKIRFGRFAALKVRFRLEF